MQILANGVAMCPRCSRDRLPCVHCLFRGYSILKRSLWTQGHQTQNIRTQLETWPIGSTGLVIYLHGWFIFSGIEVKIYKSHWSHGSESNAVTKIRNCPFQLDIGARSSIIWALKQRRSSAWRKKPKKTPAFFGFFSMLFFGNLVFLLKHFGDPIEQVIWKNRRLSCSNP